jgi:hypothetical protein
MKRKLDKAKNGNLPHPETVLAMSKLTNLMADARKINDKREWGRWKFNKKNLTLTHGHIRYEIGLEGCITSAKVLDWVLQLHGKIWMNDEDCRNLIEALPVLLKFSRR